MHLLYFRHHPRVSHRSPPRKFLSSFFYKCILQAAIDFAVLPILARRSKLCTYALTFSRLLDATPLSTSQRTTQIFSPSAVASVQLILRSCGCGAELWSVERTFRHQARVAHRNAPCSFFYKCILQSAIDFAALR